MHSAQRPVDLIAVNGTKCQPCKLEGDEAKLARAEARKKWKVRLKEYEVLDHDAAKMKADALNKQRARLETLAVVQPGGTVTRKVRKPIYGFADVNGEARWLPA